CWQWDVGLVIPQNYIKCLKIDLLNKNSCRVHVHNVQVCYICILVPCWCAAPINSSFTLNASFNSV
uniref:Uncharacterized protein n=1 Tax=Macaca fascicularis TaxID=9541 RepID=A0A7N9CQ16_MACFA